MSSAGSVTNWITLLKARDFEAAQQLWHRYFQRMVDLANHKLNHAPRRAFDEEDVALSAFATLCSGAGDGRFPLLTDRNDLWHLLVVLTARKAAHAKRDERRQKRGGGKVICEADLAWADSGVRSLEETVAQEPTPEFALQVAEECQRLLEALGDSHLRTIAVAKMEGSTNAEIASRLRCAPRTVERKLQRIRSIWCEEATP